MINIVPPKTTDNGKGKVLELCCGDIFNGYLLNTIQVLHQLEGKGGLSHSLILII